MFFFLIVVSALIFATVYVYFQALVETNALIFSVGLVTVNVIGMFGMMHSIISETVTEKQNVY